MKTTTKYTKLSVTGYSFHNGTCRVVRTGDGDGYWNATAASGAFAKLTERSRNLKCEGENRREAVRALNAKLERIARAFAAFTDAAAAL